MSLDSTKESLYVTMRLVNKDYLQAYKVQNSKKPTDLTHYLPFLATTKSSHNLLPSYTL
jgi:hypothetical protein